jgi:hypothetical protein
VLDAGCVTSCAVASPVLARSVVGVLRLLTVVGDRHVCVSASGFAKRWPGVYFIMMLSVSTSYRVGLLLTARLYI